MNEKRFRVRFEQEDGKGEIVNEKGVELTAREVVDLLNEQQDQISYWKHKVNSLLWILSQFDEEKVKKLLKEVEDE